MDGGEGRDGNRLARPPREANLLVLRVMKASGRLEAAVAVVVGARHPSMSSSSRSRGPLLFAVGV